MVIFITGAAISWPQVYAWASPRQHEHDNTLSLLRNNAVIEAQSVGTGNLSALCSADSVFSTLVRGCEQCVNEYGSQNVTEVYVGNLTYYLDYCSASPPTGFTTTTSTSSTTSSLSAFNVTVTFLTTIPIDGQETVFSLTAYYTSFVPLPETTLITISTVENGKSTNLVFTRSYTPLLSSMVATNTIISSTASNTSPTTTGSPITSSTSPPTGSKSRVWIAGPVVGGIAALALSIGAIFVIRSYLKKKRARRSPQEMDADGNTKTEMAVDERPQELEGPVENPPHQPHELAAGEH
ncbi:hypothetical protein F5Y16DRAFT_77129 [Xylariaceae sp. FL0255]|nr:hypothetical protein F5Y16DRAFT_77129 [Xylariaceae sp. FL0255]